MPLNEEQIKLILDLGHSAQDVEALVVAMDKLEKQTKETADATEKLGRGVASQGQALLQGGRVIQDFTQGGIGGILNNIEGLTMALGLGSGLAGVLTVLGVAAFTAGPAIKNFLLGLVEGSNAVPKSTDAVKEFTETIKKNGDALEELKKKQSLTNTELVEFNRLTGEQIGLEKKLTEAKKEKAVEEKLAALRPPEVIEAEKGRAEELQAQFGGRQDEITKLVEAGIRRQYVSTRREFEATPEGDPRRLEVSQRLGQLHDLMFKPDAARGIVRGAMITGTEKDVRRLAEFLPGLEGLPGADIGRGVRGVLPEAIRAEDVKEAQFDEELRDRQASIKRRNANQAIRNKQKEHAIAREMEAAATGVSPEAGAKEARGLEREFARGIKQQEAGERRQQPKLLPIPPSADWNQTRAIMIHNQQLLTQMQVEDRAALNQVRATNHQLRRQRTQQMHNDR